MQSPQLTNIRSQYGDVACLVPLLSQIQCQPGSPDSFNTVLLGRVFILASFRVVMVPEEDIMHHAFDAWVLRHSDMVLQQLASD